MWGKPTGVALELRYLIAWRTLQRTDRAQSDLRNEAAVQLRQPPALKVAYVAWSVRACLAACVFRILWTVSIAREIYRLLYSKRAGFGLFPLAKKKQKNCAKSEILTSQKVQLLPVSSISSFLASHQFD